MTTPSGQHKPWYREPWPWVAIAILAAAVVMGVTTLILAISNPDPLVVDDRTYRALRSELTADQARAEAEKAAAESAADPADETRGESGDPNDGEH
jgi:hypothetical protein